MKEPTSRKSFRRDLVSQGTVAPELAAQVFVDSMVDEGVFESKTFLLGKNTIGTTDLDSGEESGASNKETDVDALLSTLSLSSEHSVKAIGIDELDNGHSVPDDRPQASPSSDLGASVDSAPEYHRRVILESRQRMRRALVKENFVKPDGSRLVVRLSLIHI